MKLIVSFLFLYLSLSLTAQARILVVSDIDDTIKVTHVLSKVGAVASAFDDDSRFSGMSELYKALAQTHRGEIEFHYVSLAPKLIMHEQHKKFLKENSFPTTQLHTNPLLSQDPQVKINIIRGLIQSRLPKKIIYIGDNGQLDTYVYEKLSREFSNIPALTYIREAYSKRGYSKNPTRGGQVGFVTTYELALDLIQKSLLAANYQAYFEKLIYKKIRYSPIVSIFGEMVFPWWIDCRDFKWRWAPPQTLKSKYIHNYILKRCEVLN